MKTENAPSTEAAEILETPEVENVSGQRKKIFIGIAIGFFALGGILVSLGLRPESLLSQFSGASVTPSTASSLWRPSTNNPNRTAIAAHSTRLDAIIVNILGRGTNLSATGFTAYLKNLSVGISDLAKSSKYASDADVQKMSAYLLFELNDTTLALSSGNIFLDDLSVLIGTTNSGTVSNTGGTSTTTVSATSTYPGCNAVDIRLSNGQIWAACNVGAWISGTGTGSYGDYFQHGSNVSGWSASWSPDNWGVGWKWPCASGYHIPTRTEAKSACTVPNLYSILKLPSAGSRSFVDWKPDRQGSTLFYWLSSDRNWQSSAANLDCYYVSPAGSNVTYNMGDPKFGMQLRCLKDSSTGTSTGTSVASSGSSVIDAILAALASTDASTGATTAVTTNSGAILASILEALSATDTTVSTGATTTVATGTTTDAAVSNSGAVISAILSALSATDSATDSTTTATTATATTATATTATAATVTTADTTAATTAVTSNSGAILSAILQALSADQ